MDEFCSEELLSEADRGLEKRNLKVEEHSVWGIKAQVYRQ